MTMKSYIAFMVAFVPCLLLLIVVTQLYSPENLPILLLVNMMSCSLLIALSLVCSTAGFSFRELDISTIDYTVTALLAALFSTELFWGMILPSPLFIIPGISFLAVSLTSYLPKAIIYGALIGFSPKPLLSTLFFIIWGLASEALFFNPAWLLYYPTWGALLDLYISLSKGEEHNKTWLFLLGLLFGSIGWALTKVYMVVFWGNWHPLPLSLGASLLNGILTGLGLPLGWKIGFKARRMSI